MAAFRQARWFRKGRRKPIRLIVVHCTVSKEMGTGAEAVAGYFATVTRKASAHLVADDNSVVRCVQDGDTAYGAGGANDDGLHIELVGMPDQSLADWLDDYGRRMFATAGPELRAWMDRYQIPPRFLTVDEIRGGTAKGFATHADVEKAFPSTGHWDPGPNFPKGEFLAAITGASLAPPPIEEDDMTDEERLVLADGWVRDSYAIRNAVAGKPKVAVTEDAVHYWAAEILARKTTFGAVRDFIVKS